MGILLSVASGVTRSWTKGSICTRGLRLRASQRSLLISPNILKAEELLGWTVLILTVGSSSINIMRPVPFFQSFQPPLSLLQLAYSRHLRATFCFHSPGISTFDPLLRLHEHCREASPSERGRNRSYAGLCRRRRFLEFSIVPEGRHIRPGFSSGC